MTHRQPIPRKRIEAWLCLDKAEEYDLLHRIIPELKTQRAYSAAIRDGLRIMWELRQGHRSLAQIIPFFTGGIAVTGANGAHTGHPFRQLLNPPTRRGTDNRK